MPNNMSFKRFSILWLITMVCFFLIIKYVPTIPGKVALIWLINTYPMWLLRKMTPGFERMSIKAHVFVAFLWPITYTFTSLLGLATLVLVVAEWTFCEIKKIEFTDKLSTDLYNSTFVNKINDILR